MENETPELDEIQQLEDELKKLSDSDSSYGSPKQPSKENLFKFFRHIIGLDDSSKIGNLTAIELGMLKLGVRNYQSIAAYADSEGLNEVGDYLRQKAEIMLATSLSKKGLLVQLFVTSIKKEQKLKEPITEKKSWFRGKKDETTGQGQ